MLNCSIHTVRTLLAPIAKIPKKSSYATRTYSVLMARERWTGCIVPHQNAHVNSLPGTANDWHVRVEAELSRDLCQRVSHVTALTALLTQAGLQQMITPTLSNRTLSRDRSWMNPLVRHTLSTARHSEHCAQVVLTPRDQNELVAALRVIRGAWPTCPIKIRGKGSHVTGYSVATASDIVFDTSALNHVLDVNTASGQITCQPGVSLAHVQHVIQQRGYDLPIVPNALEHHSLGGFVAGHVAGCGSLKHGTLEHVIDSATLVTCESEPRVLQLTDRDSIRRVVHSRGVTGVITQLTLALERFDAVSPGWIDGVAVFGAERTDQLSHSWTRALTVAQDLAESKNNLKELAVLDSSLNDLFAKPILPPDSYVPPPHVPLCLFRVHERDLANTVQRIKVAGGHVLWAQEAAEFAWSTARQPIYHYTWLSSPRWHTSHRYNHVQLMGQYPPSASAIPDIVASRELFRDGMLMHVTWVRDPVTRVTSCYVLPVVRHVAEQAECVPTLDAQVQHVIDYHRARDIPFMDVFYQGSLHPVT